MTETVKKLLEQLKSKSYRAFRTGIDDLPAIFPVDYFGFHYGTPEPSAWGRGNVTPDYPRILSLGFSASREQLVSSIAGTSDAAKQEYGRSMLEQLDQCSDVCKRYREKVSRSGHQRLYQALLTVPEKPAETFYEACVFLKLSIYFLRKTSAQHIGLGRLDQYLYPYYLHDREQGVPEEDLFETLEAFFVSLNYDSDLYMGIQQGDNGQSLVLGGFDRDGNSVYNELSNMCMDASVELNLIDPKINLRVGRKTPDALLLKATQLTKQGLGFPQYCNDDVVIPGLIKLGYDEEDAYNYVVAACWEFIIPGCGAEVPNRATMNFPLIVNQVLHKKLCQCGSFSQLMTHVEQAIQKECDRFVQETRDDYLPCPLFSIYTDGCIEKLTDMWQGGAKYHNFGSHGAGIANATDALAAVKKCVFEDKSVSPAELLDAMNHNFSGFSELRNQLRVCPKMGNNDPEADDISILLMTYFSRHLNNRDNGYGGIWRAGTGSAMEYILSAKHCPATADGRLAGEPYSSSFSPSLDVKANGLLSILQSFTRFDMTNIINGGPLTLEIHDSLFRNSIGIEKVAMLVKAYIQLGGHQLQLNSINRDRLIDAQKHPENYPNLIVRVWGWSGYFNELDLEYQNHIIRRCEYVG